MTNDMILGPIPGNGGFRKTYEESLIIFDVSESTLRRAVSGKREKLFLLDNNQLVFESYISQMDLPISSYEEVEIIGIYPYLDYDFGHLKPRYMIEVINKDILHQHLVSEQETRLGFSK